MQKKSLSKGSESTQSPIDYNAEKANNQIVAGYSEAVVTPDSTLVFLTPDELEDQNMNISSQLSGIGVVISSATGKIVVED